MHPAPGGEVEEPQRAPDDLAVHARRRARTAPAPARTARPAAARRSGGSARARARTRPARAPARRRPRRRASSTSRITRRLGRLTWSSRGTPRSWPSTVQARPRPSRSGTPSVAGSPTQRAMSTREKWPCPTSTTSPRSSTAAASASTPSAAGRDLLGGLPARARVRPDRPARVGLADLRGGEALVVAVVPLDEPVVDAVDGQPGELGGGARARRGGW